MRQVVIRNKRNKRVIYMLRVEAKDIVDPRSIYPEFNAKIMEMGYTDQDFVPAYFNINKDNRIVEWNLEEKIAAGLPEIAPHQKIIKGKIVEKTITELIDEKLVSLREFKNQRIEYYSMLSFQLRNELIPDYKLQNAALQIYDDNRVKNYKDTVHAFKNEFIRIKGEINKAKTAGAVERIKPNFPVKIVND